MAGGGGPTDVALYKKDITHNLGYKPIVRAFAYMNEYSIDGWREIPINYYVREWVDGIGWAILGAKIYYEHISDNTIRFYGPQNKNVRVTLYIEPRKDAWYE